MRARAIDERHRLPHVDLLPEHDASFLLLRHFLASTFYHPFRNCCPLPPRDAPPEYRPKRHSRRDCPAPRLTPSVGRPLDQVGCHVSRSMRRRICPNRRRVKWLSASCLVSSRLTSVVRSRSAVGCMRVITRQGAVGNQRASRREVGRAGRERSGGRYTCVPTSQRPWRRG